jgi:hypothetical protein
MTLSIECHSLGKARHFSLVAWRFTSTLFGKSFRTHPENRLVRCGIIALVVFVALLVLISFPSVPSMASKSCWVATPGPVPSYDGFSDST